MTYVGVAKRASIQATARAKRAVKARKTRQAKAKKKAAKNTWLVLARARHKVAQAKTVAKAKLHDLVVTHRADIKALQAAHREALRDQRYASVRTRPRNERVGVSGSAYYTGHGVWSWR